MRRNRIIEHEVRTTHRIATIRVGYSPTRIAAFVE